MQSQQPCPLAQCRPLPPPPQVLSQVAEVRLQVHGLHGSLQGQAEALTRLRQSAQAAKEGALVAACRWGGQGRGRGEALTRLRQCLVSE